MPLSVATEVVIPLAEPVFAWGTVGAGIVVVVVGVDAPDELEEPTPDPLSDDVDPEVDDPLPFPEVDEPLSA
ncbi:MAG TPA: hypothetical protein VMD59_24020 [Acidimicrobiales bacterium]|nr:hypothetical protein [Acidimicrobiales bacterium]